MKFYIKRRIIAVLIVIGATLLDASEKNCVVDYAFSNTCDPYDVKVLSLKKIHYNRHRTSLRELYQNRLHQNQSIGRQSFSLRRLIERYLHTATPLRFRGTVQLLGKQLEEMKRHIAIGDQNLSSLPDWITMPWGYYTVRSGDTISQIASRFHLKRNVVMALNGMTPDSILRIGKKLILPLPQSHIDTVRTGKYRVKQGDTLQSIAKSFHLSADKIARKNRLKKNKPLAVGTVLRLPFRHLESYRWLHAPKKRRLRVTATAYTSHPEQTDNDPFVAAWNNRLRPGMKAIAVSRDLITKYGLTNGTKVKISGLPGYYTVKDKMNKRFRRRIDIYMGTDRRRALRWGRRSVVIYF